MVAGATGWKENTKEIRKRENNGRIKVEGWKGERLKEIRRGKEVGGIYSNH
jgi:hypothetical protein